MKPFLRFRADNPVSGSIHDEVGTVWIAPDAIIGAYNAGGEKWSIFTTGGQHFRVLIPKEEANPFK